MRPERQRTSPEPGLGPVPARYARFYPAAAAAACVLAWLSLAPWACDFPLNDDWVYALPVKNLLARGGLRLYDTLHTQAAQTAWGWLWTVLPGFSHGALKLSTLTLGGGAVWLFGSILLRLGASPAAVLLGALCLGFNPLFFCLALSFMTEIPYLFLTLLSLRLYLGRAAGTAALLPASLAAAGATLVRPTGLLLPLSYCMLPAAPGESRARRYAALWLPPLFALGAWWAWFRGSDPGAVAGTAGIMQSEALRYWTSPSALLAGTCRRLLAGAVLTGFFLLPFSAAFAAMPGFFSLAGEARKAWRAAALVLIGAGAYILISGSPLLPPGGSYLHAGGLGPLTLYGFGLKTAGIFGSPFFWPLFNLAALVSAGIAAAGLYGLRAAGPARACFAVFLVQFVFLLAAPRFFDRYFLYALPAALAAAALAARNLRFSVPLGLAFAALALFSWVGTADYLAWNRAKWAAVSGAAKYGLAPEEVYAGFDQDAWLHYERRFAAAGGSVSAVGESEWRNPLLRKAVVTFPGCRFFGEGLLEKVRYRTPLAPAAGGELDLILLLPGASGPAKK